MAHPYHHSLSSVKKWGGRPEDYLPIHSWFDESKAYLADFRHRALRHHAEGIFLCERIFGTTLTNVDGKVVPVRWIGEQHVKEDLKRLPAVADWLRCIQPEAWMATSVRLSIGDRDAEGGGGRLFAGNEHA
jgi:hypothetical protein